MPTIANTDSRAIDDVYGRLTKVKYKTFTFDSSYPTGGESLTPAEVGLSEILFVDIEPDAAGATGYVVQYNYTTKKLLVFVEEAVAAGGALLEVANATNLATLVVRLRISGF
jgi:hypothetical protein